MPRENRVRSTRTSLERPERQTQRQSSQQSVDTVAPGGANFADVAFAPAPIQQPSRRQPPTPSAAPAPQASGPPVAPAPPSIPPSGSQGVAPGSRPGSRAALQARSARFGAFDPRFRSPNSGGIMDALRQNAIPSAASPIPPSLGFRPPEFTDETRLLGVLGALG